MDNLLVQALLIGLLSALSLPLGALTSRFWIPSDRWIGFLMSFGGGALLAALTIDLAAPSVEKGHFYWLAGGCVIGGILFVTLDQLIAKKGGFLRKFSSTLHYLNSSESKRFRNIARHIRRLVLFDDLSRSEAAALAESVSSLSFKEGSSIFRIGDPADFIYIVEEGSIELASPDEESDEPRRLKRSDATGHMAFLTGNRHGANATALEDCRLLRIPREGIQSLLKSSPHFREATIEFLGETDVLDYLHLRQKVKGKDAERLVKAVQKHLKDEREIPTPTCAYEGCDPTGNLEVVTRIPIFRNLPPEELAVISSHCFLKEHEQGHTFFYAGENADRFYILQSGEIVLIEPGNKQRAPERISPIQAFGSKSFLTGNRHSVNAVASKPSTVMVLTKHEFNYLIAKLPGFAAAIQQYVEDGALTDYLCQRHHFDLDTSSTWRKRALNSLHRGRSLPAASDMIASTSNQHGAPLAIWLGILLDGIPESLVIGASLLKHSSISFSLIAGLFLSNYPEALSSSVGMKHQGMRFSRIFFMWSSLMVITGIGAALGAVFFQGAPQTAFTIVEGIAAGAMLTMIAQTMLPEAYLKGGSITGLATLMGFLAAVFFKTLEGGH